MEISDILKQLSILTVLTHYGLKPNRNRMLNCPFHDDKTPSMQVYGATGTVYCFSSNCKTHGKSLDVIDFVMHKEKTSKHEAIKRAVALIDNGKLKIDNEKSTKQELTTNHLSLNPIQVALQSLELSPPNRSAILETMFQYFKNAVYNSKPAREYIEKRGLEVTKIEVGYNTAQFHHGQRRDETLINNCVSVGLLNPWGTNSRNPHLQGYKSFGKECICFALRDRTNRIAGLYFRSIADIDDQKHFYLKNSSGLYPHYPAPETEKLIITESVIDTASLLQIEAIAKAYSLLTAYGTNRLNDEMKSAIRDLPQLKEIIFAFDNDEAGNKAASKYSLELKTQLPKVIFSTLALPCKDVNETLQAHREEIFIHLLETRNHIFLSTETSTEVSVERKKPTETTTETNKTALEITENTPETALEITETTPETTSKTNETALEITETATETPPKTTFESTSETPPLTAKNPFASNKLETGNPYKFIYETESALYQVKGGLDKQLTKLQVTLEIENPNTLRNITKRRFKLDLYDHKQLEKTIQEASELLDLPQPALEKDLHQLAESLDAYREEELQQAASADNQPPPYILTVHEKTEAIEMAKDKNLLKIITDKLTSTGIVGEEENKTFLFVVAISHIQENPLNALIQGSSGSGKTNLLKGIFKIMPDENKKIYSRCSEKMLYNVPKYYFKNKLICFEDVDGLGEEAEYAWRELVSNGALISGVSYKDERGNIGIKEHTVYGPITSIACTTKGSVYADNMSRLFLIAIDESKAQTQKINEYQAREAAGQIQKQGQQQSVKQLRNFTRILHPYPVHNPHAMRLKLPEGIRDERRLYRLYLHFIDMTTVLHQYQRSKTAQGKLIATKQDCQIAKDLMFECIMLKMDELNGNLRQFFEQLKTYLKSKDCESNGFTQREIRAALKLSKTHLFRFITELTQLEYLHETKRHGNQGNTYQISYWDDYKKVRTEVKEFLQGQIDNLPTT